MDINTKLPTPKIILFIIVHEVILPQGQGSSVEETQLIQQMMRVFAST